MTSTEMAGTASVSSLPGGGVLRRVRFVPQAAAGEEVLAEFVDPVPHKAVCVAAGSAPSAESGDGFDILTVSGAVTDHPTLGEELVRWVAEGARPGTALPTVVTVHGAQIVWSPARVAILATPDRVGPFLLAVLDFCYHENELRKLEREIGESWPQLEADTPLAHAVPAHDPERFEDVGQRTELALKRRVRLARMVPHLYQPRPHLPLLANQLLDRLRERTHVETRHESLVSQFEAFDRVYEMTSQRINDFSLARQGRTLEWVIIVLLATESLLLLIDLLWKVER